MINNPRARESISDSHSLILTTVVMSIEVSEDKSGNDNSIEINKNKTIENYKSFTARSTIWNFDYRSRHEEMDTYMVI